MVVNSSKVPYDIKISKICICVQRFPIKCLSRDNFPKVLRTEATHANLMKSYIVSFFYIWLRILRNTIIFQVSVSAPGYQEYRLLGKPSLKIYFNHKYEIKIRTLPFSEWVKIDITTRSGRGIFFLFCFFLVLSQLLLLYLQYNYLTYLIGSVIGEHYA